MAGHPGSLRPPQKDLGRLTAIKELGASLGPQEGAMTTSSAILVVEDDEPLREVFCRSLQRAGFEVVTAPDGNEALAACRKGGIGLVLTDIMMPKLNGFELIRALKSEVPLTPVIAISASGIKDVPDFRNRAVELGAKLAVRKPVNPHALVRLVRDFLAADHASLAVH